MDLRERVLYHQVHPLKLATDWVTAGLAAILLWRHCLGWALLVGFGPSILVSAALLRFADLTACKESRLGRYIARFMTRRVEVARFLGLAVFWGGAWVRSIALLAVGVGMIIACWAGGLVL